jgi:hypothetical protein
MAACVPWRGGLHTKAYLLDINDAVALIVLQRDIGEGGRVCLASHPGFGNPCKSDAWLSRALHKWVLPIGSANAMAPPVVHYELDQRDTQVVTNEKEMG